MANGELKIESGIPIPNSKNSATAVLRSLKVGDSVLIPSGDSGLVNARCRYALGSGAYTCRKVEGGIRVWRTK